MTSHNVFFTNSLECKRERDRHNIARKLMLMTTMFGLSRPFVIVLSMSMVFFFSILFFSQIIVTQHAHMNDVCAHPFFLPNLINGNIESCGPSVIPFDDEHRKSIDDDVTDVSSIITLMYTT